MFRSRVLQVCVALLALAVPVGTVSAGTEPDDTATDSTEPAGTAAQESGPPSASAPDDTTGDSTGGGQPPEDIPEFGKNTPMGRPGQPNEVAPSFLFLACEDASYMTGQVLHPNGGTVVGG